MKTTKKPSPPKAFKFHDWRCHFRLSKYAEDFSLAIQLVDQFDGGPIATATLFVASSFARKPNEVYLKSYSENIGMLEAFQSHKLITRIIAPSVQVGFVTVPLVELNMEEVKKYAI